MSDQEPIHSVEASVFLKISIPDVEDKKLLQFPLNECVSYVKKSVLSMINRELKDSQNYGLFLPPCNGKAGKFLQEERKLSDYAFQGANSSLELKYKRRQYRSMTINPGKLKKVHSKSNLKQFVDNVKSGDVSKVSKWLNKGMDPNFITKEEGESPLSLASLLPRPRDMIMTLVSGGAHLDFRNSDSLSPLHSAVKAGNVEAAKVLLDLGQSPNTRDKRDLTPLYYAVIHDNLAFCTERLLYEHSIIGVSDETGMQEIHQACRYGRNQHLEYLLQYGADINAQCPGNGNTPLHICANTGQENCARILLFRGADRYIVNRGGNTAYQQAVLADHTAVANLINDFQDSNIVRLRVQPKFNNKRRTSIPNLRNTNRSSSLGNLPEDSAISSTSASPRGPLSPLTSYHVRTNSCSSRTTGDDSGASLFDNSSSYQSSTNSSFSSKRGGNSYNNNGGRSSSVSNLLAESRKTLSRSVCDLDDNDGDMDTDAGDYHTLTPSCRRKNSTGGNYKSITKKTWDLQSTRSNQTSGAWNPAKEKTRLQSKSKGFLINWDNSDVGSFTGSITSMRAGGGASKKKKSALNGSYGDLTKSHKRGSLVNLLDIDPANLPRMVVLQKGPRGFGFVIKGAKENITKFEPTIENPALQFFDKIDPNSPAKKAGLNSGDFILEVNSTDVRFYTHDQLVKMIRKAGDTVAMKVITVDKKTAMKQQLSIDVCDTESDRSSIRSNSTSRSSEHTASIRARSTRRIATKDLDARRDSPASIMSSSGGSGGTTHRSEGSGAMSPPLPSTFRSSGKPPSQNSSLLASQMRGNSRSKSANPQPVSPPVVPSNFTRPLPPCKRSAGAGSDSGVSLASEPVTHHQASIPMVHNRSNSNVISGSHYDDESANHDDNQQNIMLTFQQQAINATPNTGKKFFSTPRNNHRKTSADEKFGNSSVVPDRGPLLNTENEVSMRRYRSRDNLDASPVSELPPPPVPAAKPGSVPSCRLSGYRLSDDGTFPLPPPPAEQIQPSVLSNNPPPVPPTKPTPPAPHLGVIKKPEMPIQMLPTNKPPPSKPPKPSNLPGLANKFPSNTNLVASSNSSSSNNSGSTSTFAPKTPTRPNSASRFASSKSTPNFQQQSSADHTSHLKDALALRRSKMERQSYEDSSPIEGDTPSPIGPTPLPPSTGKPLKSALKNSTSYDKFPAPPAPSHLGPSTFSSGASQSKFNHRSPSPRSSTEEFPMEHVVPPPDYFRDSTPPGMESFPSSDTSTFSSTLKRRNPKDPPSNNFNSSHHYIYQV